MPRLSVADGRLVLDGRFWFLRAAEVQYFRIARPLWEPGLARLAAVGFNAVTTYVPWAWHEPAPGRLDFIGAGDPRRDVRGFAGACRAAGLPLIVKPGPFIYAEYEGLGHPAWLAAAIPEARMRGPRGRPVRGAFWTAYSLGHPAYRAAVAHWYGQVAAAFADLWDDPIVAWQLDNETGLLYANGLGQWDWNLDTHARWRAWLAAEYGDIATLNAAWSATYSDFAAVGPPRVPFRQGQTQDYQRFLEAWIDDYLRWLRATAEAAGVPGPFSHNDSANFIPPINPAHKVATGVADLPGYDLYVKMSGRPTVLDYPWGSACAPGYFRAVTPPGRPLLAWEIGAGWFDRRAQAGDLTLLNNLGGSLAHGLQGFSLYIAHDGVEATGHPYAYRTVLDAAGNPGPRYAMMARLLRFLGEYEADLLAAAPPGPPPGTPGVLGFAFHYPDFRFGPADFLPGVGLPDPVRVLALVMSAFGIYAALLAAGYGPVLRIVNLETATPADLAACTAVVMPSKGALAPTTYALLAGYVEEGGHLITCGRTPRRTLTGAPLGSPTLYPAPVRRTRFLGRLPTFAALGWEWLVKYRLLTRRQLRQEHPTSMHIIDLSEPLIGLFYTPQAAVPLQHAGGAGVRGDYMLQTYRLPRPGLAPLLQAGDACAGYRAVVGAGSSTMIGSLPGGSYFTPQYFRLGAEARSGVRAFWHGLLREAGIELPLVVAGGMEIEVEHRALPGGGLLFLINRLPERQRGTVHFRAASGVRGPARPILMGSHSRVAARPDGSLDVDLAAGDLGILRWAAPA